MVRAARYTAAAAVGCVTVGWAFAQSPYLLPNRLTLEQAAASDATLVAVLISVAVGLILLVPSLYLLYSLVLKGRLDAGVRTPGSALSAPDGERSPEGEAMKRSRPLLPNLRAAWLVAGVALMIPFEATITRVFGVLLLFAFIVGGLFLIAEPRFLDRDRK